MFGPHFLNIFTTGILVICVGTVVGIGALSVLLIAAVNVYKKAQKVTLVIWDWNEGSPLRSPSSSRSQCVLNKC
jgi:hypothetical protein